MDRLARAEKLRHVFLGVLASSALILVIIEAVSIHDHALEERLVNRVTSVLTQANDSKTAEELRNYSAVAKPIYEWLENGKNGVQDTQKAK